MQRLSYSQILQSTRVRSFDTVYVLIFCSCQTADWPTHKPNCKKVEQATGERKEKAASLSMPSAPGGPTVSQKATREILEHTEVLRTILLTKMKSTISDIITRQQVTAEKSSSSKSVVAFSGEKKNVEACSTEMQNLIEIW